MEKKAISAVWLAETDLTNLNAGIGGSNLVDLKKYKKGGVDYPYVSGQAMRYYLKEGIRRLVSSDKYCVANDKGETCGAIESCILCDLFGFLTTLKEQGAQIRVSPIKMSPAMGLLPLNDNLTIDFLTRRKPQQEAGKLSGDIVNVELGVNIYKAGMSIDLAKIGVEEVIEESDGKRHRKFEAKVEDEKEKNERLKLALEAFKNLSDYSKQARVLTDFTPNLLLIALQSRYNHLLQKAIELKDGRKLNVERLDQVLTALKDETIYAGLLSGTLDNEDDIKEVLSSHNVKLMTPTEAIDQVISEVK
ncbi:MAG TPA: type I-B CRISPR-associated protein Cas7/Cst2/DevR [Methanomicrobia archaeon]|nr:type I-B CRISPR-associated protein Cas7/Cst2/DevR [Methanomicrobia archaeon]